MPFKLKSGNNPSPTKLFGRITRGVRSTLGIGNEGVTSRPGDTSGFGTTPTIVGGSDNRSRLGTSTFTKKK